VKAEHFLSGEWRGAQLVTAGTAVRLEVTGVGIVDPTARPRFDLVQCTQPDVDLLRDNGYSLEMVGRVIDGKYRFLPGHEVVMMSRGIWSDHRDW